MNTPKMKLPMLSSSQAQKEITHNEALIKLEAFVQSVALSRTTIPDKPSEGDCVLQDNQMHHYVNGAWQQYELLEGFECWVKDEAVKVVFWSGGWRATINLE